MGLCYEMAYCSFTIIFCTFQSCIEANNCISNIINNISRAFEAASERGASCWLTMLSIAEHGFALRKGNFMMPCV